MADLTPLTPCWGKQKTQKTNGFTLTRLSNEHFRLDWPNGRSYHYKCRWRLIGYYCYVERYDTQGDLESVENIRYFYRNNEDALRALNLLVVQEFERVSK